MSLPELVKDCVRNGNMSTLLATGMPPEVATYFNETLWPYLESLAEETAELERDLAIEIAESDDILHEETAAVFAAVIELGKRMADLLRQQATGPVKELVDAFDQIAPQATAILTDITIADNDDDDDDDEDGDDEDEDAEGKKS